MVECGQIWFETGVFKKKIVDQNSSNLPTNFPQNVETVGNSLTKVSKIGTKLDE